MNACDKEYTRWEVLELELEELKQSCETTQTQWTDDFRTALDNFAQPNLFIKNMVKGQKGFDAFLECRGEYVDFLHGEWSEAMDDLWECIEQHGHHDPA
jgi:plasmid replication initiation protein